MEILCPSGDLNSLKAAIYGGCDAIYLGGTKYSARAYASNFTNAQMKESIEYAHLYGKKVYITINTLLKDEEILDAYEYAVEVYNLGADALILQDPALIYLLHKYNKEIEIHASTQMTVHNLEGTDYAVNSLGLKRVVLSRELSLREIENISKKFETEIFVHGALCISYSGKCLMSSMLSGRSGNRGRCAQNCRMEYSLMDSSNQSVKKGFLLSPKDTSTLSIMDKIKETGTASLKIEGRMKRPEYVYQAALDYRKKVDGLNVSEKNLAQIFNREGFSTAYLVKNNGKDMIALGKPKNTGLLLGKVSNGFINLHEDISTGDGIGFKDKGFIVTKIVDSKNNSVKNAKANQKVKLFPMNYKDGDTLYKTSDNELIKDINKRLQEKYPYKLNVKIIGEFRTNSLIKLKAIYKDIEVNLEEEYSNLFEEALKSPVKRDKIAENLSKSGDTPFYVEEVELKEFENGFIPLSKLNEMRRVLLESLELKIKSVDRNSQVADVSNEFNQQLEIETNKEATTSSSTSYQENKIDLFVIADKKEQLTTLLEYKKTLDLKSHSNLTLDYALNLNIVVYPFYKNTTYLNLKDVVELDKIGVGYYIRLPEIMKEEFDFIANKIKELKNLIGIISDNYGIFNYFKNEKFNNKLEVIGDSKLNILNSISHKAFKEINYFTLSEELNQSELRKIKHKDLYIYKIYGNDELMISEYCPIGSFKGNKSTDSECSSPCLNDKFTLKDNKGESFILNTDIFCRSYIFNGKVKDNLDKRKELQNLNYRKFRIDLLDETSDDVIKIIDSFIASQNYTTNGNTRGHYKRGIE